MSSLALRLNAVIPVRSSAVRPVCFQLVCHGARWSEPFLCLTAGVMRDIAASSDEVKTVLSCPKRNKE